MKYCGNQTCPSDFSHFDFEQFCSRCGTELTPCIACLCGKNTFNPKLPSNTQPAYCSECGAQWTDAYLGRCMSHQLAGMVKEIVESHAV